MPSESHHSDLHRRFFGSALARDAVVRCLSPAKKVRIATAFFELSGWELLSKALENKEILLLVGREEGMEDRIEVLFQEFLEQLAVQDHTDKIQSLKSLREAVSSGRLSLRISKRRVTQTLDVRYLFHHAKLYMADETDLIVTSANMTRQGLSISREAGYLVDSPDDVKYFVATFDRFFDEAEPLNTKFIELLNEILNLRDPFAVYARSLLEIYGLPDDTPPGNLPLPAQYQKPVISRLVQTIEEHNGAFLVASTGLGKTIMGAHAVSILRGMNIIDGVIIFCPAGLRDMWQRSMRAARVSSREFSYQVLSLEDWQKSRQVHMMEEDLRNSGDRMLIILDESHHMRNEELAEKERRLRHRRIDQAVKKGAKLLLMTATPYSRGVDDINAQLNLIPNTFQTGGLFGGELTSWRVDRPSDLSTLPVCTVLNAPTVVSHFSSTDENGERYVVFSEDTRRYFPRKIHLSAIKYENPANQTLLKLLNSPYLRKKTDSSQNLIEGIGIGGRRDPLFEARLLHQFCSSPAQVLDALHKMSVEGGYEKMRFEFQKELSDLALEEKSRLEVNNTDDKIVKLCEIIKEHQDEKIVIFCIYKYTAQYLLEKLTKQFTGIVFESTVDRDPDRLEDILSYFAPVANDKINPAEVPDEFAAKILDNRIDILIASEAISEGFNLQDSRILINYDLPWSVLQLAQRMGRLMRPWHEPRELLIYNFIPDTMNDPSFVHATRWRDRLEKRNREHQSFAQLPVMIGAEKEEYSLYSVSAVLQEFSEAELNLEEALQFIENATMISTSTFLDDLAKLSPEESSLILSYRSGFKSRVRIRKGDPALFLLIRRRKSVFSCLFKEDASFFLPPERIMESLERIRFPENESIYSDSADPNKMDTFQEKCLANWLAHFQEKKENVRIICSLHFAE